MDSRVICALALLVSTSATASPDPLVHRFLEIATSPDGTLVATVEGDATVSMREPRVRDLVIRRVDGGEAITIKLPCGRVAECWPSSPAWTRDSRHVAFALRAPGSVARNLYTVEADGGGLAKLLDFDGTITALRYSSTGRLAMLATPGAKKEVGATQAGAPIVGDLEAPSPTQRVAMLGEGRLEWASPPDLFVYEYDWLPGGNGFVGTAAAGDGDSNWWVAKLYAFDATQTAARIIYSPPDRQQQIAEPRVSPDGRTVAFIGGIMSDFGSTGGDVYLVSLAGGQPTNLTRGAHTTATAFTFDCQGRLIVKVLDGDTVRLVEMGASPATETQRVLWSGSESLVGGGGGLSLGCPSPITATVRETFTSPPELYVGPIGAWRPLTSVNAGLTAPLEARSINWKSDRFDVQGWLLLPKGSTGPLPMITMVHGGPAAAAGPAFSGPGLTRALLEQGYAVFLPNPRGSFGRGSAFQSANVRDFGHGDLRDILKGIDAAKRAAPIDEARLGIMGGSYGGFMTMWAVTQTQRFKAAVASAGISNWTSYTGQNGIDQWMIPFFGASAYDDRAVYDRSSPINFIRNVRTPTFAYVGENDIECPAPQTQEFWRALRHFGVPASSVIYPGEGHALRKPEHVADVQQRTLAWFAKYLRGPIR